MTQRLTFSLTRDATLIRQAQALRADVFAAEFGSVVQDGLERDAFDAACDHLVLRDVDRPDLGVVATMRLAAGGAYTAREFDLSALAASGRPMAELGRTCLHRDYRRGPAVFHLFKGMLDVLREKSIDLVVGTASFPGADAARHMPALRRLRQVALAPAELRPVAMGPHAVPIHGPAEAAAMREVPSLIKSYLRAGAWIGDGAYLDRAFNSVDVCMVLDLTRLKLPDLKGLTFDGQAAIAGSNV
ncbi:MAG: GNAT family N-acyltransferase [Pseudomonadota bacterium]